MKDEKLHQAIYSAITHGVSDSNAVASDIKTATDNIMQVVMKNIPDRIWLQTGGSENADFDDCRRNVTWCQDKQHKDDVMYVSQESYEKLQAKYDKAVDQIDQLRKRVEEMTNIINQ